MEITFTIHNVSTKARTRDFINVYLAILFCTVTLFSTAGCGKIHSDWDLAVAHGSQVTFYSMSTGLRQDLRVPVPTTLTTEDDPGARVLEGKYEHKNKTQSLGGPPPSFLNSRPFSMSTEDDTDDVPRKDHLLVPSWTSSHHFKSLAMDPSRELIFFTSTSRNLTIIAVFNVTSNETFTLFHNAHPTIDGLVFLNGTLYWTDTSLNAIVRVNTTNEISTWDKYEIFYQPEDKGMQGLACDAKTKTFFWANNLQNPGKIQFYNGVRAGDVVTDVSPHGLTTDDSYLYWVDRPHYVQFTIQRVSLSDFGKRDTIYTGRYHNINSLCVLCAGSLIWTDTADSQVVLKMGGIEDAGKEIESLLKFTGVRRRVETPYGMISKRSVANDWSKSCSSPKTMEVSGGGNNDRLISSDKHNGSNKNPTTITSMSSAPGIVAPVPQVPSDKTLEVVGKNGTSGSSAPRTATVDHGPIVQVTNVPVNLSLDKVLIAGDTRLVDKEEVVGRRNDSSRRSFNSRNNNTDTTSTANKGMKMSGTIPDGADALLIDPVEESTEERGNTSGTSTASLNGANSLQLSWCSKDRSNSCLNGGSCVVVGAEIFCLCLPGFMGKECEKEWSRSEETHQKTPVPLMGISDIAFVIVCSTLSVLVVILVASVIFLYMKVRRLDKKPKIRRRVIVSRSGQRQRGSSVCELIDIENCCNMNECETPCYDRGITSNGSTSSSSNSTEQNNSTSTQPKLPPERREKTRKEDKERLIDF